MESDSDRHGMLGDPRHAAQPLQAVVSGGPSEGFYAGLCATSRSNLPRGKTFSDASYIHAILHACNRSKVMM